MTNEYWEKAKSYMLPYEGTATQIYGIDIPAGRLRDVLAVIAASVTKPAITVLDYRPLEELVALDSALQDAALPGEIMQGQATIHAQIFGEADITFDLWPAESKEMFDLEVWFWADQFFPGNDRFNCGRFETLLIILKNIVGDGDFKCILTPYEASDPREDLQNGLAMELQVNT